MPKGKEHTTPKNRLESPGMKGKDRYLYREIATVDIVAKEQIHGFCRITTHLEQFHKVVILAMNIATH